MARPVVICPSCGFVGKSWAIVVEGDTSVTLQGNQETCKRCGRMANIVDGVLEVVGGVGRYLFDGKVSVEQLEKVQRLIDQGVTVTSALDQAKVNRVVASPIRWVTPERALAILALMVALLTYISDQSAGEKLIEQGEVQSDLLRSLIDEVGDDRIEAPADAEQPDAEPPPGGPPAGAAREDGGEDGGEADAEPDR